MDVVAPEARCDFTTFAGTGRAFVRRLLPALFVLERDGFLHPASRIHAVSDRRVDKWRYRALLREVLHPTLGPLWDDDVADRLLDRVDHVRMDLSDERHWLRLARALERSVPEGSGVRVFHLPATLPATRQVCSGIRRWGLRRGAARALLETPVGHDLASARLIGGVVATAFEESQVYRLDPVLGGPGARELMTLPARRTGQVADPAGIDHVQVTVAEAGDPGTRGRRFDRDGALRHMVQGHGLQLLSLVAMAPPAAPIPEAVRDARLEVLRSLRPMTGADVDRWTVRGRYVRTPLDSVGPSGTADDPDPRAETFVALRAELSTPRWEGVPFYLRTGTRLRSDDSSVVVVFADGERAVWRPDPVAGGRVAACARLLRDVIRGDPTDFVRDDEMYAAWAWIQPITSRWRRSPGRPSPYTDGGVGPLDAAHLLHRDGRRWHDVAS